MKSRLAQRQNWPDWSAVQRGRDELLSWGGVVGREADVAWSQMTFLVPWNGFFFLAWLLAFCHYLGSVGSHRTDEHWVDATLEQMNKASALWEGGDPGSSQFELT